MKTDTQMTIEQYESLIDADFAELQAKKTKAKIIANESIKYKIDTISYSKIDDSNLMYNNASESVVDVKVEEAKAFAQSAKDYKDFCAWNKLNKANSKPIDISIQPVKSNIACSTKDMFAEYNRYKFDNKKYNWSY